LRLFEELGIDACLVVRFDRALANMEARDFVEKVLVKGIGCRWVYVGENFRFGRSAKGDSTLLERLSSVYGFRVRIFKVARGADKRPISSTYIRRLVLRGELKKARALLARPVSVFGEVKKGNRLGKKLGFPTANIDPHHEIIPPDGVYAVRIILKGRRYKGACYIGPSPAFVKSGDRGAAAKGGRNIEVHILGFRRDIYRERLEIQFMRKLRPRYRFTDKDGLVKQVEKDITQVRQYFSRH
jgi:riboflavin kinase/FMN adenylyltransferase